MAEFEHGTPTPDPRELQLHLRLGHELIPLHRWDFNREEEKGKSPRDVGWRGIDYSRFDAAAHMAAGGNVGRRIGPSESVLDVDPRNFAEGEDTFERLCRDLGVDLSDAPRVDTGSGGFHLHMTRPPNVDLLVSLAEYPGIELKSHGFQVVAAGSVHPTTGRTYRWDPLTPTAPFQLPDAMLQRFLRPTTGEASDGGEYSPEQVASMLAALPVSEFDSEEAWFPIMAACHHASAGAARQEFLDWCSQDPRYRGSLKKSAARWDSMRAGSGGRKWTAATLLNELRKRDLHDAIPVESAQEHFALVPVELHPDLPRGEAPTAPRVIEGRFTEGEEGDEFRLPPQNALLELSKGKALDNINNARAAIVALGLEPRFNLLKQTADFARRSLPWPVDYGRVLDDRVLQLMRFALCRANEETAYQPSATHLYDATMQLGYLRKYNPVLEWLDSLEWDGVSRVEHLFSRYFRTTDGAYERAVSRCFMVGAVRRMRQPGCKLDTMPILDGPQGWDKSTGLRALFSDDWFSDAQLGDMRDKDAAMNLRGTWLVEFAELDSMSRTAASTLKAFCSRAVDRYRAPYAVATSEVPRQCVFAGTVNERGYLTDGTGNRRFWPLSVLERVDVAAILRDRAQLWAEANRLEADGVSQVLPQQLWAAAGKKQAEQTTDDPWVDDLRRFLLTRWSDHEEWLKSPVEGEPEPPHPKRVLNRELLTTALGVPRERQTRQQSQRLRQAMERLGWKHKHSVRTSKAPEDVGTGFELHDPSAMLPAMLEVEDWCEEPWALEA